MQDLSSKKTYKKIKRNLAQGIDKADFVCYNLCVANREGRGSSSEYAPLAQLVEQLTLNQWVRGSSPRRCTKKDQVVRLGFFYPSRRRRLGMASRLRRAFPSSAGFHPRLRGKGSHLRLRSSFRSLCTFFPCHSIKVPSVQ